MKDEIDEMVRDTYRYFYVDGLVEVAIGFLFLVLGLVVFAWLNLDTTSWPGILAVVALIVFTIGGSAIVKRVVGLVKERVTYQRTGYVAYDRGEPGVGRWPVVLAAVLLVLLLSVLPDPLTKMPFVVGALLGILLAFMGYRVSLIRFYLLGGIAFAVGLAAALLVADELVGATLTFAGSGLALLVSGAIILLSYVQEHPQVGEE